MPPALCMMPGGRQEIWALHEHPYLFAVENKEPDALTEHSCARTNEPYRNFMHAKVPTSLPCLACSTLIAPPAAQMGILWLCASRALVGLGEGVAPSAATTVLARLMPSTERARAVSMVWGGLDVGSAVGLLLSGPLIRCFGWPSVFYLFAIMGLIWCCFWPAVKKDEDTQLNAAPAEYTSSGSSADPLSSSSSGATARSSPSSSNSSNSTSTSSSTSDGDKKVPWGAMFRSPAVWAVTCAHFCFNWGYYTLLAWLPSYFELALGLNVEKSSILTLIPYAAMIAMMPLVSCRTCRRLLVGILVEVCIFVALFVRCSRRRVVFSLGRKPSLGLGAI